MLSSTAATANHPLPWLRRLLRRLHRHRQIHRLQRLSDLSDLHTVVSVLLFDQFRHLEHRLSDPKIEWVRRPWPTSPSSMTSLTSSTHRFSGLNFLGFFFCYFPPPLVSSSWVCWVAGTWWLAGWDCGLRLVGCDWRWVVLFRFVSGVGGQWSGCGLGFANLLVVVWVCWDVKFGGSNFILLGLNLIFWVLNLLGLCSCSNI